MNGESLSVCLCIRVWFAKSPFCSSMAGQDKRLLLVFLHTHLTHPVPTAHADKASLGLGLGDISLLIYPDIDA